jgi:hypothetical protein
VLASRGDRDRLYLVQSELNPAFVAYQANTTRIIPVIALNRLSLTADLERHQALGEHLMGIHNPAGLDRPDFDGDGCPVSNPMDTQTYGAVKLSGD